MNLPTLTIEDHETILLTAGFLQGLGLKYRGEDQAACDRCAAALIAIVCPGQCPKCLSSERKTLPAFRQGEADQIVCGNCGGSLEAIPEREAMARVAAAVDEPSLNAASNALGASDRYRDKDGERS